YGLITLQFFALLIALKINRKIEWLSPSLWILLPASISVLLVRSRFSETSQPTIHLPKFVGCFSAFYSLFHYLLLPLPEAGLHARYAVLFVVWGLLIVAGVFCFR